MRRPARRLWIVAVLLILPTDFAYAEVVTYPRPEGIEPSDQYRVEVVRDGVAKSAFVYKVDSQWRSNRHADTSWTTFSFDEPVVVRVTKLGEAFTRCRVLPSSRGIVPEIDGDTAVFRIDRPGQLAIEFDERTDHPMLIFADPLEEDVPSPDDPNVVFFGPGVHELEDGVHRLQPNQTTYLAGGAYVKGRILGRDAANACIRGRGVLSGEDLPNVDEDGGKPEHFIDLRGRSDNVTVEGVTLVDSPHFNLTIQGADAVVRNVKMISWWFSTDGVHVGDGGLVEDCFFKVNDDALKLYQSNTTVRRCVIWQLENGAPFQISWNMPGDRHGFRISDCDVIRVEHKWDNPNEAVFDSIHGGSGHMHDYVFEDIRIENADWRLVHLVIMPNEFARSPTRGWISDIVFRDVTIDGPLKRPNLIRGFDGEHRVSNVTFENLRIGGRLIRSAEEGGFEIDPETTRDVRFVVEE